MNWIVLKSLNELYLTGRTPKKDTVLKNPYIHFLLNSTKELFVYKKDIVANEGFKLLYESKFLDNYSRYHQFLSQHDLLKPQMRYRESDIQTLMFIQSQKEQVLKDQYSRRKFSSVFFKEKGSKHLDKNPALEKAVLSILGLDQFPGKDPKDQQYKFVVDCPKPRCIVLCENIDFLLLPWIARDNNIKLWYAGGNNIAKLDHLPDITLPIYYSCDWDYDGLKIYERIKAKIPQIILLHPSAIEDRKSVNSPNHKSDWKYDRPFSGLDIHNYSDRDAKLIESLIVKKEWIEEECNDLIKMVPNT